MTRGILAFAAILLLSPCAVSAATVTSGRTLVVSEPADGNGYFAGTDVNIVAPSPADILAAGGTVTINAPVEGDLLLAGGTVSIKKPIAGDVRIVGGELSVDAPIEGDFFAAGGSVVASTSARDIRIAGGTVRLSGGSRGSVTIYGADVYLSGSYQGDVEVVASDRIVIQDGTVIQGDFKYNAPQQVVVPPSAHVDGKVRYTGSSEFLPTNEEAKRFAIAGAGVLFIVRIMAAVIAAGLLAGLFPVFAEYVSSDVLNRSLRRFVLLAFLGFAVAVAAPVFIVILLVSFVGIGIALILAALYVLLLLLSYLYAGVIAGSALSRGLLKRTHSTATWRMAVLGMLILYLIGIIPGIGTLVILILTAAAAGSIVLGAYGFAFGKGGVLETER